jgi:hypothetical protein
MRSITLSGWPAASTAKKPRTQSIPGRDTSRLALNRIHQHCGE